jgi:hypothetical protein
MAYNPMYQGYQPLAYQQLQIPQPQPQSMQNTGIIWVSGEAGAKSYLVAPNTTAQLWDSESPTIYLKSADASGMPSMKIIDYTVRGASEPHTPIAERKDDFVTHTELRDLEDRLTRTIEELKEVKHESTRANANGSTSKK